MRIKWREHGPRDEMSTLKTDLMVMKTVVLILMISVAGVLGFYGQQMGKINKRLDRMETQCHER